MKNAMRERERELAEIEKKLKQTKPTSVDEKIEEFRRFAIENIERVVGLCREKAGNAKYELGEHCGEITMTPLKNAEGERFYVGTEYWNLLGSPSLCLPETAQNQEGESLFIEQKGNDVKTSPGIGAEHLSVEVDNHLKTQWLPDS
jgi:hypothetical protein